jgi:glutamate-1-semialdehyde 2,1-aminomutase
VLRAVADSLAEGQCFSAQHAREVELAEALVAALPAVEMVRFASSGTEAVQVALRLARAVTGRRLVVKFEGHYHGWVDGMLVSTSPALNAAGPDEAPVGVLETAGQSETVLDDLVIARWNDLDHLAAVLDTHAGRIAAIVMEPMMVNKGALLPRPGYLDGVRALATRHGALFVLDEVITGFRLGHGGAQGLFGVDPDLTVLAKAIAGGFTLSAVGGKTAVMERLTLAGGVVHGGTYNGNVVAVAAALATLKALVADDGRAYRDIAERGGRLIAGIRASAAAHRLDVTVTGLPAVFNVHFGAPATMAEYRDVARCDQILLGRFVEGLMALGVRIVGRGTFFLSAAHADADVSATLAAVDAVFADLRHYVDTAKTA